MLQKSMKFTVLAAVLAAGAAMAQTAPAPADAASRTPLQKQEDRQAAQQSRIASGAAGGQLSARETKQLEKRQHRIDNKQQKAMADGEMSAKERRHIAKAEDKNRKAIKRMEDNKAGKQP